MEHNKPNEYDEMDLDEQARMYEDDIYESYSFGERLGEDGDVADPEASLEDDMPESSDLDEGAASPLTTPAGNSKHFESGFGEAIKPTTSSPADNELEDSPQAKQTENKTYEWAGDE